MNDKLHANSTQGVLRTLVISLCLLLSPAASAQPITRPCAQETAPADDFQSPGIGLTRQVLETLYGEPEIGQGSLIFDFDGVNLHKDACDVTLTFPPEWAGEHPDEVALAESTLPADAELVGSFVFGTPIAEHQLNTLWRSPTLAAWFAALGEPRGDQILLIYTYDAESPDQPIQRVELRTVERAA